MMTAKNSHDVVLEVRRELLSVRNLFTVVNSESFREIFDKSDPDKKDKIKSLIASKDSKALAKFIRSLTSRSIEEYSLRELRKLAQECGVSGYSLLPKASLLSILKRKEKTDESGNLPSG